MCVACDRLHAHEISARSTAEAQASAGDLFLKDRAFKEAEAAYHAKHKSLALGVVDDDVDDRILRFIFDLEHQLDFAELTGILPTFVLPIS